MNKYAPKQVLMRTPIEGQVIYEVESIWNYLIVVNEINEGGIYERTMAFHNREMVVTQARWDLNRPEMLVSTYAQAMIAFALWQPVPGRVFNIGLGSGLLAMAVQALVPGVSIDNVDNDPLMPFIAEAYFGYDPSGHIYTIIGDGADVLEKMPDRYCDVVLVDAFGVGASPPSHLWNSKFFGMCKDKLTPGGIVAINVMESSPYINVLYDNMREHFKNVRFLHSGENWILFATDQKKSKARLVRRAEALDRKNGGIHDFAQLAEDLFWWDEAQIRPGWLDPHAT